MINIRHKPTRRAIDFLSQNHIAAAIQRSDKSRYDVLVNFEITRSYRSIRSARRHLLRLAEGIHSGRLKTAVSVSQSVEWVL